MFIKTRQGHCVSLSALPQLELSWVVLSSGFHVCKCMHGFKIHRTSEYAGSSKESVDRVRSWAMYRLTVRCVLLLARSLVHGPCPKSWTIIQLSWSTFELCGIDPRSELADSCPASRLSSSLRFLKYHQLSICRIELATAFLFLSAVCCSSTKQTW